MNALEFNYWVKRHWLLLVGIFIALVVFGETVYQIVYPAGRLIPGTTVDGVNLGGMRKEDAVKKLDGLYGQIQLKVYFGKNGAAFLKPTMQEVGIGVDNTDRLDTINYPTWLRFVPTSIFWAPAMQTLGDIAYKYDKNKIADYTQGKVGEDCSIPAQNASLKLVDSQLQLVPSLAGGRCDLTEFQQQLAEVVPSPDKENSVYINADETPAPISDDMARDLAGTLNSRLGKPMPLAVDSNTENIPGRVVLSWLDFTADVPEKTIDNSGNAQARLLYDINEKRMLDYLHQGIAAKLIKTPGVSKITTLDFTETSRANGANGRDIDLPKIKQSVLDYIVSKNQKAVGVTKVVGPTLSFTRKYTPTSNGFRALLQQFAEDNPSAKWSMAFVELTGVVQARKASYNLNTPMKTAGIHSLYLAYTNIMEEYAKNSRPVDLISGSKNAEQCFKDMLQLFDGGCRDGFYKFYGFETLTRRTKELGLTGTTYATEDTVTSAGDLEKVMTGLFRNEIARLEGGGKILSGMRTARDRAGIPDGTGVPGQMSHVIGESDTVHNDAAIVYDTNYGAYSLVIMSDGTTDWSKVAKLADMVHSLKKIKIPKGES